MERSLTLEESFEQLEKIIGQMENGNISLNDSFKLYNEGINLIKDCNCMLDKVEKEIVIINGEGAEDGV